MHFLIYGADYAIVEDDAQAAKHVAAGYERATYAEVRARWRDRDLDSYDRLWEALLTRERSAGRATESAPLSLAGLTYYDDQGRLKKS
jgi:hypothetical protein